MPLSPCGGLRFKTVQNADLRGRVKVHAPGDLRDYNWRLLGNRLNRPELGACQTCLMLFYGKLSILYDANAHTTDSKWGLFVILVPVVGSLGEKRHYYDNKIW